MNIVTANFNTTVCQMTKMSQQKMTEMSLRKKQPWISGFHFIRTRRPLFLSLIVINCSGEWTFSRFKRIKNELNGRKIPGEVAHTKFSVH